MASSSSAHYHQQVLSNMHAGATAAPPPTPCTQTDNTSDATADAISRLLHRLPPALSLPTRRSPRSTAASATAASLPEISMSDTGGMSGHDVLSAATEFGYFQLIPGCRIPSELPKSAETESLSLFELTEEQKETCFPKAWPLGYEAGDEEEAETPSFCLDADCSADSGDVKLSSLREFTRALEKLGLEVVEKLASEVGFENPFRREPTQRRSLLWVQEGVHGGDKPAVSGGGFYPFVVGLQYQIRKQKYSLLGDSGWVTVSPRVGSVLVTLGDVAQVWSNGKLKRVRGRAVVCSREEAEEEPEKLVTMTLLLTLPLDAMVSPQDEDGERRVFRSFSFEDYAWRVSHERLLFNDPLDKHRIRT